MPSNADASVKLLYAVDQGQFFTIDDVALDASFDVILNVEIGAALNSVVNRFDARVGIRNLTQSVTVAIVEEGRVLMSGGGAFLAEERINIPANWSNGGTLAQAGDVLQAVATYRVTAGANFDFSTAESHTFVVS